MNMNKVDKQYLDFLNYILENGEEKGDRTGTGTISIFDYSMSFDMAEGFPLLTSKKVFTKAVIHELIWFLRGDTNIKYLVDNDVHIWDGDAYKNFVDKTKGLDLYLEINKDIIVVEGPVYNATPRFLTKEEFIDKIKTDDEFAKKWGELGPVYGKQWRHWGEHLPQDPQYRLAAKPYIDQIANLINDLKNNPDSRRLMVSAWNVGELDQMVLPPCHFGFQCYTTKMSFNERVKWWCDSIGKSIHYASDATSDFLDEKNVPKRKLSLKWFQRSCDVPLGIPFNISSYAILLHLLAKEVNMVPHLLKFNGGDCHVYLNQIDGVKKQLKAETFKLPKIKINNSSIFDTKFEDIEIVGYKSSPTIQFPLSN
jgi:thymidylate synthase